MASMKTLELPERECETVRDWFMFVGENQRTNVDKEFNAKLDHAIWHMKQGEAKNAWLSAREAQIVERWYHLVNSWALGPSDDEVHTALNAFLEMNGVSH